MASGRFPGATLAHFGDLEIELVEEGVFRQTGLLDALREEVLEVAAASRGWTDPGDLELFHRCFKLGPLYEARAMGLVRRAGRLVGLAGSVNDWMVEEGSIVHLCSLGLLPDVQARGILPVLMFLLWQATLRHPVAAANLRTGRLFSTAITQSPYVLWFLSRFADLFPSPERQRADGDELAVARHVVSRFDPHLTLEERHFVLRHECEFRYRRIPYSLDRRLNRFCDSHLRYDDGDVFVAVGRPSPIKLQRFQDQVTAAFPKLLDSVGRNAGGAAPEPQADRRMLRIGSGR